MPWLKTSILVKIARTHMHLTDLLLKALGGNSFYKGKIRDYQEANRLGVIDKRIADLVKVMNQENLIFTIGSCQGHGFPFIKVPPYVSFKTCTSIALRLDLQLRVNQRGTNKTIHYPWKITTSIDDDSAITYVLEIPAVATGKIRYPIRYFVDKDILVIKSIMEKVLNHIEGKELKIECRHD